MRTTVLLLFCAITLNGFAQNSFTTGEQTLLNDYKAQIDIDGSTKITTLTLKGPANVWLGIGFGGERMRQNVDVFRTDGTAIVDAISTGSFLPSADASQDWALVSNEVSAGIRTIIVTRANNTGDANDYVFNASAGSITVMYAHGTSQSFAFHGTNFGSTVLGVTLSTKENKPLSFGISPNPSTNAIDVQLPFDTNSAKVQIFDFTGRLLKTTTTSLTNKTIDVSNLATGTYFITVSSKNKVGTKRFIKN